MATINNVEVQGDKNGNDYGLANLTDLTSKVLELTNKILANATAIADNLSEINLHKANEDRHVTPALINSLVRKEVLGLYYTAAQVAEMINDISVGGGAHLKVVDELPETGLEQIIYLVPNGQTGDNVKDEYIWIDDKWEVIGSTSIDLTDYYTKNEVNNKISELDSKCLKNDDTTVVKLNNLNEINLQEDHYNAWFGYRGGEVTNWKFGNGSLGGLADVYANDFYLNDESLSDILDDKANTDEVYTKTEVDTKIADLVDSAPEALDTLNELANALDNDPNFATTILSLIGSKVSTSDLANYLPITTTFESLATNSIPFHNTYPRCKYLGTSISSDQNTAIKNRTYDDLFIGDYWTINGINWRIVAIDYYYNIGDTNFDKGNIIVMPDIILYSASMNNTDTTAGAYHGSLMRTQNLNNARTIARNAFGSHLANHRILLANAVDGSGPSNWAWYDSDGVELPNEVQIFGTRVWGSALKGWDVATQKQQFPLIAIAPQFVNIRQTYWLQDVSSASVSSGFASIHYGGGADHGNASKSLGVRPSLTLSYI